MFFINFTGKRILLVVSTGVGIIITDDETVTLNYETMVLYTTGSALDYREILTWYKNNIDMIEEINI